MAADLHLGRGLCRGLYRDPDRGLRPDPPRLDLPEVLEVLPARPLVWWSIRRPAALVTTLPKIAISSFRFSPMASPGLTAAAGHPHNEDRTGLAQSGAVPIRTVSEPT